jgi:hypothetical protein
MVQPHSVPNTQRPCALFRLEAISATLAQFPSNILVLWVPSETLGGVEYKGGDQVGQNVTVVVLAAFLSLKPSWLDTNAGFRRVLGLAKPSATEWPVHGDISGRCAAPSKVGIDECKHDVAQARSNLFA